LVGDAKKFQRVAHFKYLPLPGGEAAILHPAQMAVSFLWDVFAENIYELNLPLLKNIGEAKMSALVKMIQVGINAPLTSSLGRIFDAVSVILNYREKISYEGEAAVALEMLATGQKEKPYPFALRSSSEPAAIDLEPTIKQIVEDLNQSISKSRVAARFHATIIEVVVAVCQKIEKTGGLKKVCLSGGCFMNRILLEGCYRRLTDLGFEVYFNSQVPINDGGLAVGQALIANARKEQCA